MKKKLLYRCLFGAPIGVVVSLIITMIISLCTGNGEYYPAPHELTDWCGSEITAAIGGGSSVIWDMERWSLTKQTLIHFAVLVIPFVPLSYVLNWMPHNLIGGLCYAVAFIGVYVLMWISVYFSIKAKIKKLNRQLQQIRRDED